MNKQWTPNEKQQAFIKALASHDSPITLLELRVLDGLDFASGSINPLITKGFVAVLEDKIFPCDVVYNDIVVGHTTKKGKPYMLTEKGLAYAETLK